MFSRFPRWWQPRWLVVAAVAVAVVLSVPTGRAVMTMTSRPVGGVAQATPTPTATPTAEPTASPTATPTATPSAEATPTPRPSKKSDGSVLFSDDFAGDALGCLGGVVNGVPGAAGAVTGATGAVSGVTGTVGAVTGSVTGSLPAGVVTGTVSSAVTSVTGTACAMSGQVSAVTGSVTGTAGGVTGVLPGGWVVDGTVVPTVVQDGTQHLLARVDHSWSFLSAGESTWVDYTVSSLIKTDSGAGVAGIAARVTDAADYYSCQVVDGTSLRLVKVVGGKLSVLSQPGGQSLAPDTFHTVSMLVTGNHIGCILDGRPVLQSIDGTLTHGRAGLVGVGSLPAEFGAFRVLSLPANA